MLSAITALSADDIGLLNDTDLRVLVEKLCRAELQKQGLPVSGVTAGGHQTAPDGGIDVRVEASQISSLDFIKRHLTGFQVKCSDMSASKIKNEMKVDGQLKSSIQQILLAGGAYVIVCSQGSVADGPLRQRRKAMHEATSGMAVHPDSALDFYDAKRLADWVGLYPGVEHWVRERIAKPMEGWSAHGAWTPHADDETYCVDETQRVVHRSASKANEMSVAKALEAMAQVLIQPGGVVRLIGLSGTGKTRLVEALFDPVVHPTALDKSVALYTDQGDTPSPTARDMLSQLGRNRTRAVVVVDNCPPQTHTELVKTVGKFPGFLSLITVEFDVATRDDEPDATEVFELCPSSRSVLDNVLARHAPHVTSSDRYRIAELSDGNARVALALVRTLAKGETLGTLNDSEVFDRLFHQGRAEDQTLLLAAQVCSLVYSFDVETEGEASHVNVLAPLAGQSPPQLYRSVATLKSRDLVQSRGKWRAVLPHALANRLAKQALQHLQPGRIEQTMAKDEHLLKSFGRRLSFLHDSTEAVQLAKRWFADPDWLGKPEQLNALGMSLFKHLAAVAPEYALATLTQASQGPDDSAFLSSGSRWTDWPNLLRHLAHDVATFERAAMLLHAVCLKSNDRSRLDSWLEMFGMYLSGTMATVEQRLAVVQKLMESPQQTARQHAAEALGMMLKTSNFRSHHDFRFGSRPARTGWEPSTVAEQTHWFESVLATVTQLALQSADNRRLLKPVVGLRLEGLLLHMPNIQRLPPLVSVLADLDGWPDAWVALHRHLRWHGPVAAMRQTALQEILKLVQPSNFAQRVRAHVLVDRWTLREAAETREERKSGSEEASKRVVRAAKQLGGEAAHNFSGIAQLLPEFMTSTAQGFQREFGESFAIELSPEHIEPLWRDMVQAFADAQASQRNDAMLQGFLSGASKSRPDWVSSVLDASVNDPVLGPSFPSLQHCHVDDRCVERLSQWIAGEPENIRALETFSRTLLEDPRWGPATVRDLYTQVAQLERGHDIAVEALMQMLWSCPTDGAIAAELLEVGSFLLRTIQFSIQTQNYAFKVTEIAKRCIPQVDSPELVRCLCLQLVKARENHVSSLWDYCELAEVLLAAQPEMALDAFLNGQETSLGRTLLTGMSIHSDKTNPINSVPIETLKQWVLQEPATRAALVAREIKLTSDRSTHGQGLSEGAEFLLEVSGTSESVLQGFEDHFHPTMWVGSLAQALSPYLALTQHLAGSTNPTLAAWAASQSEKLRQRMDNDWLASRAVDESFE
jgi:hypothetical protein